MIVRILSCGVNWWAMHSRNLDDPYCFRRKPVYFNTTGLMYGRRLRDCQIYPGLLRFNRTSQFDPEFVERLPGKTFEAAPPTLYGGKVRVLFQFPATGQTPDAYLVTLHPETHGGIEFHRKCWKSPGLRTIAVSKQRDRYEAMLLMEPSDWVMTDRGRWEISPGLGRLELKPKEEGNAL
jgi:hypothetical protein